MAQEVPEGEMPVFSNEGDHSEARRLANLWQLAVAGERLDTSYADMLLSEVLLRQDWDSPEDDAAWTDL